MSQTEKQAIPKWIGILPNNIKAARKYRGWSQTVAAEMLGWPRNRLSFLESGIALPSGADLSRLVEVYGVATPEDLYPAEVVALIGRLTSGAV